MPHNEAGGDAEQQYHACSDCLPASCKTVVKNNKGEPESTKYQLSHPITPNGFAPLHCAVGRKHLDCVLALIDHGADVNQKCGPQDWAPLLMAIDKNFPPAATALLDAGADVDTVNKSKNSALYLTAQHGWLAPCKFLLDRGAKMNNQNYRGDTCLIIACDRDRRDVVQLLLERGADCTIRDQEGVGPVGAAVAKGNVEVVRMLVEHAEKNLRPEEAKKVFDELILSKVNNSDGFTVMASAAKGRRALPFVVDLCKRHPSLKNDAAAVDLNDVANKQYGPDGSLPLHIVASTPVGGEGSSGSGGAGQQQQQAPAAGPSPSSGQQQQQEDEAEVRAAAEVTAAIDCLVKECGADVNAMTLSPPGYTPLFLAANNESCDVALKHLLKLGADPNLATKSGTHALSAASGNEREENFKILLEHPDINVDVRDPQGMRPLEHAIVASHSAFVSAILEKYVSSSSSSSSSTDEKDQQQEKGVFANKILSHKAKAGDGEERTAMELAQHVLGMRKDANRSALAEKKADKEDEEDDMTDNPAAYFRKLIFWDMAKRKLEEAQRIVKTLEDLAKK